MTSRPIFPGSQPPSKPPNISNPASQIPPVDASAQEVCARMNFLRSSALALLQDTEWPPESNEASQNLLQTIKSFPELPKDTTLTKDSAGQFIHAVEDAHTRLKTASEKYGTRERGIRDGIKYRISSLRPNKCIEILRTCREDIEKTSAALRDLLDGNTAIDSPENEENQNPIRSGVLVGARKTFKTVEAISGTIPGVGSYVGVVAKVGLAFVSMIETMDKNEDVARELTSHVSKLSTYLEHFKKKSDVQKGDEVAKHIDDVRRELECVQKKVSRWNSLGRFKKAFLSSDHAGELKAHQDAVQTALEEMQLLVGLKTADLVFELKNTELQAERRRLLGCLGDGSYGARGNSIEDVICLLGTRVEILERIDGWIKDTSASAERVLWIHGMAGRGKSTIASTVAHNWRSKGSCAIFHFRRGQNALDDQFVCALARQLGKSLVPEVKEAILDSVKENQDIAKERLNEQFKTLLVGSLAKLGDHAHPIVIIVDALDECKNVTNAVRFIKLVDQYSSSLPTNVKFLLTCRPEAPLLVALEPRHWHVEGLDSIPDICDDVTRFIQHACKQIREERNLPRNWPSSADVERIVEMSQGLFQWARTAITYVHDGSPVHRLRDLLQRSATWSGLDDLYHQILSKAFDKVKQDSMRQQLLSWVLGTIVVVPYPVSLDVIASLYSDHEIFDGQDDAIQFLRLDILADLNSLLHIPASPFESVRLMHTSIRDLLISRQRCETQHFFIDVIQDHRRLASLSLQMMGRELKQNICELSDISKASSEVQDAVEIHVSKGLQYCCRVWSTHLIEGVPSPETKAEPIREVLRRFESMSEEKLLFWLEVMSLMGKTNEALTAAKQTHQWLLGFPYAIRDYSLTALWDDVQRFIVTFHEPISFGALHIYASALPHCPVRTTLWEKYSSQATMRILHGKRQSFWPASIWASSVGSAVTAVAFSPDGRVLASASFDCKIRLRDAQTGGLLGEPLGGHNGVVRSIAFSPNSEVLASGSDDKSVRLWEVETGTQLGDPLRGHSNTVQTVAFSPDGKVLASGSEDRTVRLWDAQTKEQLGDPLLSGGMDINSIAFSPDGRVLASACFRGIRLWDAHTRAVLGEPLGGHSGIVYSIAFSPDGKFLASGSFDETVRLWDTQTGGPIGRPLTTHRPPDMHPHGPSRMAPPPMQERTFIWGGQDDANLELPPMPNPVHCVAFSPNSTTLAAGFDDGAIRLWNVRGGAHSCSPLIGHGNLVRSVTFSPDGGALASGSYDKTVRSWDLKSRTEMGASLTGNHLIRPAAFSPDGKVLAVGSASPGGTGRLWNAETGAPLCNPLTPHKEFITSFLFSADSRVLATVSGGKLIQLWDAETGAPLGSSLTGHSGSINSLAFYPEGKVLAAGLDDQTVRLWEVETGAQLGKPLTGHSGAVESLAFSPDGKVLASGSNDKTVRLWKVETGAQLGDPLRGHRHTVKSVAFSLDGKILASGSADETVRLWGAQTGEQLGDPVLGHGGSIESVAFSASGHLVVERYMANTLLLDPLTRQIYDDDCNNFSYGRPDIRSNWAMHNAKRLLWFPVWCVDSRFGLDIIFSHGRFACTSPNIFSILDVSRCLKF